MQISGSQLRVINASTGTLVGFPPVHEHHVHVGISPPGERVSPADTQMLSKNGDFNAYADEAFISYRPHHFALPAQRALNVDAFLWDVRPANSTPIRWLYEISIRVKAAPTAGSSAAGSSDGGTQSPGAPLSKWKWPTIVTAVPTHGSPSASFYTAQLPFAGTLTLPRLAHFHLHGVIARDAVLLLGTPEDIGLRGHREACPTHDGATIAAWRAAIGRWPHPATNMSSVPTGEGGPRAQPRVLCRATEHQTLVDGVAFDRMTEVHCDAGALNFTTETTLTSVVFDGPSHENWWYWQLKGHMYERAYTHHTLSLIHI